MASCTATTVGDLTLCSFDNADFRKLLGRVPRITQRLLEMTLDEVDAALQWMVLLGKKRLGSALQASSRRLTRATLPKKRRQSVLGGVQFQSRRGPRSQIYWYIPCDNRPSIDVT